MRDLMNDEFFELEDIEFERASEARFAYIREISLDEASFFVQVGPELSLRPGTKFYAVRADDGKMIGVTDSWAAAYWTALSNDLSPLSVH